MIGLLFESLKKYKKFYIIIVLQIFLSAILILTLLCKLESISEKKKLTSICKGKNMYYFTLAPYMEDEKVDMSDIYSSIDKGFEVGTITDLYVENIEDEGRPNGLTGFSDSLIKDFTLSLEEGEWFSFSKSYNNIPTVVIGKKYKVGEIIILDEHKDIKLEIIGRMSPKEYGLEFNSCGNDGNTSYDHLFTKAEELHNFIIPYKSEHFKCIEEEDLDMNVKHLGEIVVFPENVSENKIVSTLENYGVISNIDDLEKNFEEDNEQFLFTNGVVLLIFTLLTIAGIGGINCMINIRNQKNYVIYYIYGMSNKQLALLEIGRVGFVMLISSACMIAVVKHTKVRDWVLSEGGNLTLDKYLVVIGFMIVIFTITTIPFVYKLYKSNLIEMYKQKA